MKKLCFALSFLFLFALEAYAASETGVSVIKPVLNRPTLELINTSELDGMLADMENRLDQVESKKSITADSDIEGTLDKFFKQLVSTNKKILSAIQESAKQQKAAGGLKGGEKSKAGAMLEAWELKAEKYRAQMTVVTKRVTEINNNIAEGSITLAPEYLKTLSPKERGGLKEWMSSQAATPKFDFNGIAKDYPSASISGNPPRCGQPKDFSSAMSKAYSWATPDEAEAALAVGCVAVCGTLNPTCVICVGKALGSTVGLVKAMGDSLRYCESFSWKWVRISCKAAVIVGFAAAIA